MTQPPHRGITALRLGALYGLVSAAVSLANPILGATLFYVAPNSTDYSLVSSTDAHTVQYVQLALGLLLCALAAFFTVRAHAPIGFGILAGLLAGQVGALVGALINLASAFLVPDAARNFLVALGGDVSYSMPQGAVAATFIAYGVISLLFAVVTGAVAGIVGSLLGLAFRKQAPMRPA